VSRWRILMLLLLTAGVVGIWVLQRKQASTEVTPRPLLYLVADTQRELERIPLELTRVSIEEENQLGEKLARSFGLTPADTKDPEVNRIRDYVNEVGLRVTGGAKRSGIRYRFHYNPSEGFVNAAALPGGQIVIGKGLLQLLESEDELASILGHEIAHIDQRHSIGRLQYELKSRKLGLGGLYRLGSIGVQLFQAGYTKEQELESDREGLRLAVSAGYSPGGAIDAMKRLEKLSQPMGAPATSPVEEIARVPVQALQEYFRSHPPARERIAAFEDEIAANGWKIDAARRPMAIRAIFLADGADEFDRRGFYDKAIRRFEEAIAAEPKSARARRGLARARWHSGDAAGAATAAEEALRLNAQDVAVWDLLAHALAVSDRATAPARYAAIEAALSKQRTIRTLWILQTHQAGLELFARRPQALERYRELLKTSMPPENEAAVRSRMAWWMYRSEKLPEALRELDAARQRNPDDAQTNIDRGWVLSEMGRQADAREVLEKVKADDEVNALHAVIDWRLERRDAASNSFRAAIADDPIWMEQRWVANAFNAPTAKVLAELRTAELARRKKEALRAVHPVGAAKSN